MDVTTKLHPEGAAKKTPPTAVKEKTSSSKAVDSSKVKSSPPTLKGTQKIQVDPKREAEFSEVEQKLQESYNLIAKKAVEAKRSNDTSSAIAYLKISKTIKQDIEYVQQAKLDPKIPLPGYHIEQLEQKVEKTNKDISLHEMEISVIDVNHVVNDCTAPYFLVTVPYPNAENPAKFQTPAGVGPKHTYNFAQKVPIERKKSFQFFCERKKVTFELWHHRTLLSDIPFGKAELKLNDLLDKTDIEQTLEVKNGRKLSAEVTVRVSLFRPLLKAQIELIQENIFMLDREGGVPVPATTTHSNNNNIPKPGPSKAEPATAKQTAVKKAAEKPEQKEEEEDLHEEEPEEEEDPWDVEFFVSNDAMEWEIANLKTKVAQYGAKRAAVPEDITERMMALELKMNMLAIQVETGQLSQETYFAQLQHRIQGDREQAKKFLQKGNKEMAAQLLKRSKVMEKELELSAE